jgi:hypothetical protein
MDENIRAFTEMLGLFSSTLKDWQPGHLLMKCTDERFQGESVGFFLKDKGPKHPEVIKIGGGAYFGFELMYEKPGEPGILVRSKPVAVSLN